MHVQLRYWLGVGGNGFSDGGGGVFQGEHTINLAANPDNQWHNYPLVDLPNNWPAADYVDVIVRMNQFVPFSGTFTGDNFVVTGTIPEPATLSLVGLSGLAMLVRRRRAVIA